MFLAVLGGLIQIMLDPFVGALFAHVEVLLCLVVWLGVRERGKQVKKSPILARTVQSLCIMGRWSENPHLNRHKKDQNYTVS